MFFERKGKKSILNITTRTPSSTIEKEIRSFIVVISSYSNLTTMYYSEKQ